jgi:hypothetical protein
MSIAIPGARGVFSHLQAALQTRNLSQGRIRMPNYIQATLKDFSWLANSLQDRQTRLQELVAQPPCIYGMTDASGQGMGGIIMPPTNQPSSAPMVWRLRFPTTVQRNLVSVKHPKGTVTNSDLELAATVVQHDAICHSYDARERTVHTGTDNQATQAWQQRGSTTTNAVPAFCYGSKPSTSVTIDTSRRTATYPARLMLWQMMPLDCGTYPMTNF